MIKLNKNIILLSLCTTLITFSCNSGQNADQGYTPVDYVNPYMGNISHLLVPTFPTIHLPNSMLRLYPVRGDYTDVSLHGLPLFLTSHRGRSAFNLSPYQGDEEAIMPVTDYSYDQEKLTPYSYSVYLDDLQIQVDFGLSHQSAEYDIAFENNAPAFLILNSMSGKLNWDGKGLSGFQEIGNGTRAYLYLIPEQLPAEVLILKNASLTKGSSAEGQNACLVLTYPELRKTLHISYGVSFISETQAKLNMERELSGKSIKDLQAEGRANWNKALGKIAVEGGTSDEKTVFYTSLYRYYERPVCISENGKYFSAFDGMIHDDKGRPFYTDDWIWDAYRAHHPLRILLDSKQEEDIINSLVLMAEQSDHIWLPTFPRVSGDSRSMNSNHGVATILDAQRKGLDNFDIGKAYEAAKGAIMDKTLAPWSGKPAGELDRFYHKNGYIPALKEGQKEWIPEVHPFERRQPVAVTLGTAYDQWCLSQLANELGKDDDADYFLKASFNYRNLFNPKTGFFHPKDSDGNFIQPFDYRFSGGMGARGYYDENNGWVYRWDVQHNIPDLIDLMGGNKKFVDNLDAMFNEPLGRSKFEFYAQLPDQTGNVGQFSMANEPALHIPYLYNYAGQPWKTQKTLHKLLNEWFRNDLMGVPGDEDGGGMSSFVVFSFMGFYPVTPGLPLYAIGSPWFEHTVIDLGNGKTFEVIAESASPENKYIQSAQLNGEELKSPWILHEDIIQGGKLVLEMGPRANRSWGSAPGLYHEILHQVQNK